MTEPTISLRDLLKRPVTRRRSLYFVELDPAEVAALVEAVEAQLEYGEGGHSWRCEYRTAEKGWKEGDPPIIECRCGLDRLYAALARFTEEGT